MSWLTAHESYVMETIARDRVNELRSMPEAATDEAATDTEHTGAPPEVLPDARPRAAAAVVLCPRALAKASR